MNIYKINQTYFDEQAKKDKRHALTLNSPYDLEYLDIICEAISKNINSNKSGEFKILDTGCGLGQYLCWFNSFAKAWGVDISFESLKRIPDACKNRILVADFNFLPFEDEVFDLVFSNHSIEHTLDKKVVLSEFHRVLKNGGLLFIAAPNKLGLPEIFIDFTFRGCRRKVNVHLGILSPKKLIRTVNANGFNVRQWLTSGLFYPSGIALPLIGRFFSLHPFIYLLKSFNIKVARAALRLERQMTN